MKMRMRGIVRALALASLAGAFATACEDGSKSDKTAVPPPAVTIAPASKGQVNPVDYYVGQTKAQDTVDLVARVEGFLVKRNFTEGQMVKQGDLLLQIEKDQYEANVEASKGALDAEQAKLNDAVIEFNRQAILWKKAAVAQKDYDNALYTKLAEEAKVSQADANLKLAQINLGYTDVFAPFDGCVGLCTYSVGNVVSSASGKLATIVRIDPLRIEFNLDEMDVLRYKIKVADKDPAARFTRSSEFVIRVQFQDGSIYKQEGKVAYADNHINISTGTLLVQAEFPNPDKILIPGMYVKVLVSERQPETAILVPARSVLENQSGSYVYVVGADSKVVVRQIKTNGTYGQLTVVASGLSEGEKVVVEGLQKVRPGAQVQAVLDSASSSPEAMK